MPYFAPATLDSHELHIVGTALAADLYARMPLPTWVVLELDDVLLGAVMAGPLTPQAAVALVASATYARVQAGDLTEQSARKLCELQARLVGYLSRHIADIADADAAIVQAWVVAKYLPASGPPIAPDDATVNLRCWAADDFFRTLRRLGRYEGHPLLDYPRRPKGGGGSCRPLLDSEVDRGRDFAARTRRDTRGPAAWAAVEAGAATGELMRISIADATARAGWLWLTGDRRHHARWVRLTEWGAPAVSARIEELTERGTAPDALLVYEGTGSPESQQASACDAIHETLGRAGLRKDPTVKPASLRAWAAVTEYRRSGDLVAVAALLGCRSFDEAARIVGLSAPEVPPPDHRSGA